MGARRSYEEILRSRRGELRMTRVYKPFHLNMQSSASLFKSEIENQKSKITVRLR
jgi:hypothetical protein